MNTNRLNRSPVTDETDHPGQVEQQQRVVVGHPRLGSSSSLRVPAGEDDREQAEEADDHDRGAELVEAQLDAVRRPPAAHEYENGPSCATRSVSMSAIGRRHRHHARAPTTYATARAASRDGRREHRTDERHEDDGRQPVAGLNTYSISLSSSASIVPHCL